MSLGYDSKFSRGAEADTMFCSMMNLHEQAMCGLIIIPLLSAMYA